MEGIFTLKYGIEMEDPFFFRHHIKEAMSGEFKFPFHLSSPVAGGIVFRHSLPEKDEIAGQWRFIFSVSAQAAVSYGQYYYDRNHGI